MRGLIPGMPSPHPLGAALPAMYAEDEFAQRLMSAFDETLAPAFAVLDNFDAYLDPHLTPEDFLEWVASWVGAVIDENWTIDKRRRLVSDATYLYRWRGTAQGVAASVALYTGVVPEISENGGTSWSDTPGSEPPGSPIPSLVVRVRVPDPTAVDENALDAIVSAAKPAHVPHQIEVIAE